MYSYDSGSTGYSSPQSAVPPDRNYSPNWQPPPRPAEYNPLYVAASDVLGMGPPPGGPGQPYEHPQYPPPHHHPPPSSNHGKSYNPSISSYTNSYDSFPPSQAPPVQAPPVAPSEAYEIEPRSRPSLERTGTSTSVAPSTTKSRAIDLTTPPYTKEYIEQYRQRIKGDPDPEAHFLYAKYLIDAAKKIRAGAQDQRAAKKYSEMLIQESLKVIKRLATQGEAYHEAQFFLANCHGTGALGLQVDHERAYHLYLQAAKQNHAAASYRVAVCNEIGAGTRKEPQRAAAFYRKAASLGDTPAMFKLGMILLHGSLEQPKNPREAVTWLKRAAEQADEENPHALHELGLLHEQPNSALVQYDPVYAKALFTQGAQLGYTQSQYKLGQCYEYGSLGCPVDPRRSIAWYTKAAEKGDAEAELALSGWYLTGSEGVLKQSDSEAYLWARRAANKGLSKAEYAVGYYAEVGIGIKQDIEFARKWYMRAAAQGNKKAMNRLTEMKRQGNKRLNISRPTRQEAKDDPLFLPMASSDEPKDVSLLEFLDLSQLNCLNESLEHPLKPIVANKSKNTSDAFLLSDADEQLLVNLHFNQAVRIRSLVLTTKESSLSQAPKDIKLVVNRRSIGFEDVEDATEPAVAQIIELSEEQVKAGKPIPLRFVRFQNVNSLTIFVESNQGEEDESRIDAIDVFGIPVEATKDLSGLRRTEE
ncbi:Chitin synthase regulatory factor 3 [Leucoagaricus sp. SymC.cos]|nr:Chitin synthase regulatory factor 3 [Leucoagaricus sp. SymC.cos]